MRALAYVFAVFAVLFIGRFDLRTDDSGVVAFFVLAAAFVLGVLHPRRAWIWAGVGLCVPVAEYVWRPFGLHTAGLLLLTAFVMALGLAGTYSGAFVRKTLLGVL